jgi:glycine dehydrogenase
LVINQYHKSRGESNRRICLIPKSAHGTNPASAYIAGFKVVPIEVNEGMIDLPDLKRNAEKYKNDLGALMITFPSTAGIY